MATQNQGVADRFRDLLDSLKKTARVEEVEHVAETSTKTVSQSDAGNKDALAQGKGAGSTTGEATTAPAQRQANGNEPGTQELGADPSSGEAPSVTQAADSKTTTKTVSVNEGNKDAIDQGCGAGSTVCKTAEVLTKQAETMDVEANGLLKQIATHVVAELALRKYAEAIDTAGAGIAEGLDLDPEIGGVLAEALASGEITEEQIADAAEKTDAIVEICDATGATPEQVIEFGNMIDEQAPPEAGPEDIADAALAHQAAIEEQETIKSLKDEYAKTVQVLRKAEAEKDEFRTLHAKARISKIVDVLSHYAAEMPVEDEAPVKKGKKPVDGEAEGDEAATEGDDAVGEEQLAAEMLGAGIPEDEVGAVQSAIGDLQGKVDEDVLKQAIADEITGNVVIPHEASPEELMKDEKTFVHVYLRTALQTARLNKAQ